MSRPLRLLLGVSGGIAAYKTPDLVRRLRERGHQVRCALTRSAASFVAPLSLEVVSEHAVLGEEYLEATGSGVERHMEVAQWAEVVVIAPATSHTLARLALGLSDDFLTTVCAAWDGPLVLAPAMHTTMWRQPVLQGHVATLIERGARIVGPVSGPLASGESGAGRLAEAAEIADAVAAAAGPGPLSGRTVVVSAGPTREPIDPVRFLSNRSSGKMGFALAAEAAARGARTLLVAGPVDLPTPPGVERHDVATAAEMRGALLELAPSADLVLMAAAVADFRPVRPAREKLKKRGGPPAVELEPTPDILSELAAAAPDAVRVGFAAETSDLEVEAAAKLEAKRLDFILANDVSRSDIGFGSDHNELLVLERGGPTRKLARQSKRRLAAELLELLGSHLETRDHRSLAGSR